MDERRFNALVRLQNPEHIFSGINSPLHYLKFYQRLQSIRCYKIDLRPELFAQVLLKLEELKKYAHDPDLESYMSKELNDTYWQFAETFPNILRNSFLIT